MTTTKAVSRFRPRCPLRLSGTLRAPDSAPSRVNGRTRAEPRSAPPPKTKVGNQRGLELQVVVLAGGFSTRLHGAIPNSLPKPMAPISGKPSLEHLFDRAIAQQATALHLIVGYKADVIARHSGARYSGVPVTYSYEEIPLGTGGALRNAAPYLDEQFLLVVGDTFAEVDYSGLLGLLQSSPLAMCLANSEDVSRYGSVATEGDVVVNMREKSTGGIGMVDVGTYGCKREQLSVLSNAPSFSFEVGFLEPKPPRLRPRFLTAGSGIIDIGTPPPYALANAVFGKSKGMKRLASAFEAGYAISVEPTLFRLTSPGLPRNGPLRYSLDRQLHSSADCDTCMRPAKSSVAASVMNLKQESRH